MSVALADIEPFLIDPSQGWSDACDAWRPLAFVDLDACNRDAHVDSMPPFPVIGVGDREHPLAATLDAVIESPISAASLIRQVGRAPQAAAVTAQLLRASEGLPILRALMFESLSYGLLQGSREYSAWLASRAGVAERWRPGRVIVERHGAVLDIVLDRPEACNAIDREMRDRLFEAFTLATLDTELRSVRLRSVGAAFSAGGDLDEFGTTTDPATAHLIRSRTLPALALAGRADILNVHVQGACIGAGIEIAAFAARLTAAPDAWFQLPELAMGLLPGAGGCVSVPRRIGRQRAALMMLSGQQIDVSTALSWGLIDAIENQPPIDEGGSHVS